MNEGENRSEPPNRGENQIVMFMKKPQERKTRRSCGAVVSMDGKRSYTVKDDTTGTVRFTSCNDLC